MQRTVVLFIVPCADFYAINKALEQYELIVGCVLINRKCPTNGLVSADNRGVKYRGGAPLACAAVYVVRFFVERGCRPGGARYN